MSDQDEDLPTLSADTFAALKQFYKEEEEREAIKISTKDQPVQDRVRGVVGDAGGA